MKNFVQGAIFVAAVLPVIEGLLGFFNQVLEWVCTKIAVSTYKAKKDLEETPNEETSSSAIGFTLSSQAEE